MDYKSLKPGIYDLSNMKMVMSESKMKDQCMFHRGGMVYDKSGIPSKAYTFIFEGVNGLSGLKRVAKFYEKYKDKDLLVVLPDYVTDVYDRHEFNDPLSILPCAIHDIPITSIYITKNVVNFKIKHAETSNLTNIVFANRPDPGLSGYIPRGASYGFTNICIEGIGCAKPLRELRMEDETRNSLPGWSEVKSSLSVTPKFNELYLKDTTKLSMRLLSDFTADIKYIVEGERLNDFTFSHTNVKNVEVRCKEIGNSAFRACQCLDKVKFVGTKQIGSSVFCDAINLKRVEFPDMLEYLPRNVFEYSNISEFNVPKHIDRIPTDAFYASTAIKITIPKHIKFIEPYAFAGAHILREIIIPEKTLFVSDHVFSGCFSLETIIALGRTKFNKEFIHNDSALEEILFTDKTSLEGFKRTRPAFSAIARMASIEDLTKHGFDYNEAADLIASSATLDDLIDFGYSMTEANEILKRQIPKEER